MALAASRELAQLALGQCQVDPAPTQAETVRAKAAQDRLAADQCAIAALPGVEPHRVGPRREIGAVDRDLSAGPDPIAPLEPHAIGHDDVRLHLSTGGGVGLEVVNVGAARGVHLERIADAGDGPQIVERGAGERRAGPEVLGVDIPAGLPPFAVLVVGAEVGVHRQGRVAVLHVSDELDDVPAVGRDAVALHGDLHVAAAEAHVPAGEVVGPGRRLVHRALAVDVVDLEGATLRRGDGLRDGLGRGGAGRLCRGSFGCDRRGGPRLGWRWRGLGHLSLSGAVGCREHDADRKGRKSHPERSEGSADARE